MRATMLQPSVVREYVYRCAADGCGNLLRARSVDRLYCAVHAPAEQLAKVLCPTTALRLAYMAFGSLIPKGRVCA
jgi:hypothetical protein